MLVARHTAASCALSDGATFAAAAAAVATASVAVAGGSLRPLQSRARGEDEEEERLVPPPHPTCSFLLPLAHRPLCIIQLLAITRRPNSRTKPLLSSDVMLPRLACRACMSGYLLAGGRAFRSGTNQTIRDLILRPNSRSLTTNPDRGPSVELGIVLRTVNWP